MGILSAELCSEQDLSPLQRSPHLQVVGAFTFDRTSDGRSLKWLSLIDEYTRECLALEARRGMTAEEIRVILAEVAARREGPPHRIRSDNGPEFAAEVVRG